VKPRVLIVDDSVTVRMDLQECLEEAGFFTTLCATLAAARALLERETFDIAILDVLLPDGDGLEFLGEIKSVAGRLPLPVILLSSEDEVRDRVRGLRTGADEYLGKPYDRGQVIDRARALLRKGRERSRDKPLILVIDDSATFRSVLVAALEQAGYDAAEAATGEDGLRLGADLRPDALVVDGVLPGIAGLDVIRTVRGDSALRRTPCLLLTASSDREEELRALEAGADQFVCKGEDMDMILVKLRVLIRPEAVPLPEEGDSLLGPKRILAVDDSATFLGELSDRLREDGYDVVAARSGEEALELLAVQKVDAVLLDVLMPGLSGQETCLRIKANPAWRDIPLLMLTALEERDALLEGINAGADDYITKSDRFEVLKARLKAQLRRCQFEEENRRYRERLLRKEMEALEMQAIRELAETRASHIEDLERKNEELRRAKEEADTLAKELESFSYSVSHDLRAPLRGIDAYGHILLEKYKGDLDAEGGQLLEWMCESTCKMGELIDDMLGLAQVTRQELVRSELDFSALAESILADLRRRDPDRQVEFTVQPGMVVRGDRGLLRILLENLFGNAWKFTAKTDAPRIVFGEEIEQTEERGEDGAKGHRAYAVRDNGAGFDMAFAHRLFKVFQRLHLAKDFPGTGVGLATVARVVRRHGGRAWAESRKDEGASFFFTLGEDVS
jgi:DNA-binding response OmpR family regulator